MSNYNFPFKSYDFDVIYTNIAETLKVKYPQNGDTLQIWYRKLLYELMSYVQSQFEPIEIEEIIPAKNKNNKKKNNAPVPDIIEPLFSENIERALEIIYQDSNFAIYLLSWFLPILVNLTDIFDIYITLDNSDTPASSINIKNIHIIIDQGIYNINFYVNGKKLSDLSLEEYLQFYNDPFLKEFLKSQTFFQFNHVNYSYDLIKEISSITYDNCDPQIWSFRLARFLWDIKTLLEPLYINNITFATNLQPDVTTDLKKDKNNKDKNNRKRFNVQKYITSSVVSQDEMSAQIIRTLIISTFRTFFDFDESTITQDLFDYLFNKKPLQY